jgi:hypothetical protein
MSGNQHCGGQIATLGRAVPAAPSTKLAHPDVLDEGFGIDGPRPIASLALAGEPIWWWLPLLDPRAGLMFLLWATRNPHNALLAAELLGGLALARIVLGAWS